MRAIRRRTGTSIFRSARWARTIAAAILLIASPVALGFQIPRETSRFEAHLAEDPSTGAHPMVRNLAQLETEGGLAPGAPALAAVWRGFRAGTGERWSVWLDARSGAPTLVQGEGIPWIPGSGNHLSRAALPTIDSLAASLRAYVRENAALFVADESELVLDRTASAAITPELWQIVFGRQVGGVPVTGDGYVFSIGHGNLISFGSPRWSTVAPSVAPALDRATAFARLREDLGMSADDPIEVRDAGSLVFTPTETPGTEGDSFSGAPGTGYRALLTWRFEFAYAGEAATWVALVDARTGHTVALYDDTKYARVKGGVYPVSNNGTCPDGCEQAGFPIPYANLTVNGAPAGSNGMGKFTCSGGNAVTALTGPYVNIADGCGAISQSIPCDNDLDLGTSAGTDCVVPAGASLGDTHAARTSFYHVNRAMEHGRGWLPGNLFLTSTVSANTNIASTCSANSTPSTATLHFYRDSGSTCRNSGEIASVIDHEWGHLLSFGDGNTGLSNPDEAYADITAFMLSHRSCIGPGFFKSQNCSGYGNACVNCTGVRDVDWAQRSFQLPTTVSSMPAICTSGTGPCGRQVHCESAIVAEALWDLANRDLPAAGLDAATSWLVADRLWFASRQGSSGAAYLCGSPASMRSCGVTHWMQQLRVVDDDDGNLANGTPHAAAIFAAFNRHEIPCGAAGDPANQSMTVCPALMAPALGVTPGSGTALLSWTSVAGAATYRVLRNDLGCAAAHSLVTTTAATTYNDAAVVNGKTVYYAVQAVGSNASCAGALSNCVSATPSATLADLNVSMTDTPDPVSTNQTLIYDVSVVNLGPGAAINVNLIGQVTSDAPFVSLTKPSDWSCTTPAAGGSGSVSCTVASVAGGSGASFHLVVRPRGCLGNGAVLGQTMTVTSAEDPVPGNNSASTTTTVSDNGQCSDGDPCTNGDSCSGGTCQPGPPLPCMTSNPCQSAACITGTGCVISDLPDGTSCKTGNTCTADFCQNGTCVTGPGGPPEEVGPYLRIDKVSDPPWGGILSFNGAAGTTFSVYRGSRQSGQPWAYNHACRIPALTNPVLIEDMPPLSDVLYYLMSRRESCGESILGRSSAGIEIPNTSPCP